MDTVQTAEQKRLAKFSDGDIARVIKSASSGRRVYRALSLIASGMCALEILFMATIATVNPFSVLFFGLGVLGCGGTALACGIQVHKKSAELGKLESEQDRRRGSERQSGAEGLSSGPGLPSTAELGKTFNGNAPTNTAMATKVTAVASPKNGA